MNENVLLSVSTCIKHVPSATNLVYILWYNCINTMQTYSRVQVHEPRWLGKPGWHGEHDYMANGPGWVAEIPVLATQAGPVVV